MLNWWRQRKMRWAVRWASRQRLHRKVARLRRHDRMLAPLHVLRERLERARFSAYPNLKPHDN